MLVLRLQRTGRKNLPTYRIVVTEHTAPIKSGEREILGHYLPAQKDPIFSIDTERTAYWISKGAKPSDTLARLLKRSGVKDMEPFIKRYTKQKSKKAPPEAPQAPAAETSVPTPTDEAPALQENA